MSKHTPGPWIVWNDGHGNLSVRSANERDTADATYLEIATEVGGMRTGQNFKDHSEEEANARLIAAAPDLISFARDYISAYENGFDGDDHLMLLAKSLVAKVTGGTHG